MVQCFVKSEKLFTAWVNHTHAPTQSKTHTHTHPNESLSATSFFFKMQQTNHITQNNNPAAPLMSVCVCLFSHFLQ